MFKTLFPVTLVNFICGVSWCKIRLSLCLGNPPGKTSPKIVDLLGSLDRGLYQKRLCGKKIRKSSKNLIAQLAFSLWPVSKDISVWGLGSFLHFLMAARKQAVHFDKSKFVLFSVFGRFCWKFFFPYGSNYGLSLTTKLHVIELLFVNFLVLLWLFLAVFFQSWWTLAWASTRDSHVVIFSGCGRRGVKSVALSAGW